MMSLRHKAMATAVVTIHLTQKSNASDDDSLYHCLNLMLAYCSSFKVNNFDGEFSYSFVTSNLLSLNFGVHNYHQIKKKSTDIFLRY